MSKKLPTGGFKWLDHVKFTLGKYQNDSLRDRILEGDLEYPKYPDCTTIIP